MTDIIEIKKNLWGAVNRLHSTQELSMYKYKILGLIFLKCMSDVFGELYSKLKADEIQGADPEDPDEYLANGVVYLSEKARWTYLQKNATNPDIGFLVDDASQELQQRQPNWRGVLPEGYAAPDIDLRYIGEWIDLISRIDPRGNSKEVWSSLFEYLLWMFADGEGKSGGEFYSPRSVVKLMTGMLAPTKGRIYDPCCGSGGMFIESARFIEDQGGDIDALSIFGQEFQQNTAMLATMNLAIRGLEAVICSGDTFQRDAFPDMKANYIFANPPFNMNWRAEEGRSDGRWQYGIPPSSNANYAWLQHCLYKLSPNGFAAIVMPNGSLSSNTGNENEIRRSMIEARVVECIVTLPSNLFFNTTIPVSLWILSKNRNHADHKTALLFIDATQMGKMLNKRNRELSAEDIALIRNTYRRWSNGDSDYKDVIGFCRSTPMEEVANNDYSLLPSRYVGIVEEAHDDILFEEKMRSLTDSLSEQFVRNTELEKIIRKNLQDLGYELQ